jgi:hypothetical protein
MSLFSTLPIITSLTSFRSRFIPLRRRHPKARASQARLDRVWFDRDIWGIPFDLVRSLAETYRTNLPAGRNSDVVLGIHCHVARDREEVIENGALALS